MFSYSLISKVGKNGTDTTAKAWDRQWVIYGSMLDEEHVFCLASTRNTWQNLETCPQSALDNAGYSTGVQVLGFQGNNL